MLRARSRSSVSILAFESWADGCASEKAVKVERTATAAEEVGGRGRAARLSFSAARNGGPGFGRTDVPANGRTGPESGASGMAGGEGVTGVLGPTVGEPSDASDGPLDEGIGGVLGKGICGGGGSGGAGSEGGGSGATAPPSSASGAGAGGASATAGDVSATAGGAAGGMYTSAGSAGPGIQVEGAK